MLGKALASESKLSFAKFPKIGSILGLVNDTNYSEMVPFKEISEELQAIWRYHFGRFLTL